MDTWWERTLTLGIWIFLFTLLVNEFVYAERSLTWIRKLPFLCGLERRLCSLIFMFPSVCIREHANWCASSKLVCSGSHLVSPKYLFMNMCVNYCICHAFFTHSPLNIVMRLHVLCLVFFSHTYLPFLLEIFVAKCQVLLKRNTKNLVGCVKQPG